jgi:hypothetical protein
MTILGGASLAAVVAVGGGAYTAVASAATTTSAYAKVSDVAVSSVSATGFTVSWKDTGSYSGTTIRVQAYNADTKADTFDKTVSGTSTSETVTGLAAGTAYELDIDVNTSSAHTGSGFTAPETFYTTAAAGAAGTAGAAGAQGPSGVVSETPTTLVSPSSPMTANTGGSFTSRKTPLGTVTLAAGTYLLNVNAMVTPATTSTGNVFPQLEVYSGAPAADFSNYLFNVGNGAIEDPTSTELTQGNLINGFLSASDVVTVPSGGETLNVYAFGYDSDQGQSSYTVNSATVTATQLQTQAASS